MYRFELTLLPSSSVAGSIDANLPDTSHLAWEISPVPSTRRTTLGIASVGGWLYLLPLNSFTVPVAIGRLDATLPPSILSIGRMARPAGYTWTSQPLEAS